MLTRLTAAQFIRVMTTGRTSPLLCGCADRNGKHAGEFVVKFLSARGALLEFVASRLARHFGILVPEPAAIEVGQEFAKLVSERLKPRRLDPGLKFGSKVVNPMAIWLVDRSIPEAMFRDAANIFAFDALIQNPDRRVDNPNLFTQGDNIYVYDHEETCFSFLMALSPSKEPWNLTDEAYLDRHVFYGRLRNKDIDLVDFGERLRLLTAETMKAIRQETPREWARDDLKGIEDHLAQVQSNEEKFVEHVRRRLS